MLEACHRLALSEGQKENKGKKGVKRMKVSKTFKIFAAICELLAFILVILGLAIRGFDYDLVAVFYAVAFGLALLPIGWFIRSIR